MNEEEIKKSADQFVSDVRALFPKYNEEFVLNIDQSDLEFEIHSNRTLSHQGEKTTLSAVRSINETTHGYTVQSMIRLSGKIVGPIYLCLKEPNGRMSDKIKAHLYNADNVVITCSTSDKLTNSLVEYWRDHVLIPSISLSSGSLLLSDSWSGQSDAKGIYKKIKGLYRREIPPKTTPKIQPATLKLVFPTRKKCSTLKNHKKCSYIMLECEGENDNRDDAHSQPHTLSHPHPQPHTLPQRHTLPHPHTHPPSPSPSSFS